MSLMPARRCAWKRFGAAALSTLDFSACRCAPKCAGGIEPGLIAQTVRLGPDHASAELEVPQHFELASGTVVIQTDEPHDR